MRKPTKIIAIAIVALCVGLAMLLPLSSSISQSDFSIPSLAPGQSATLLPDGRWLLVGGQLANGRLLSTAEIWDARSGVTTLLSNELRHARAYHSATALPDGTVFIFGGVDSGGQVVGAPELFHPSTETFLPISQSSISHLQSSLSLLPRSHHSATLLTDGRLLIAGGVGGDGQALDVGELWDTQSLVRIAHSAARRNHTATLLPDGNVLLSGGLDNAGNSLDSGELFDSSAQQFASISPSEVQNLKSQIQNLELAASIPADGSAEVSADSLIALRFSKPVRVETINSDTVILTGPKGIERIEVIPAEGGRLTFITPESPLLPGSTYTVTLNGPVDRDGLFLPLSGFVFTTMPSGSSTQSAGLTISSSSQPETLESKLEITKDDDSEWKGERRDGKPYSKWQDLPPLKAEPGMTALAGHVLDLAGRPLANVTLEIEAAYESIKVTARTDESGRFLLKNLTPGWSELTIDGRPAHNPKSEIDNPKWGYGVFEYGVEIKQGETNVLPFTIWLPKIDEQHAVKISSPTTAEVVVTTPRIPGLELRIPPNTVIYDHDWEVVKEVGLTPIPLDRTPFPLATNIEVPLYFTAQPGGAYIRSRSGIGARVIYPNKTAQPPGAGFNFWHYDPGPRGWYIYGQGTVTKDGKQVVPDPGVSVYEFTGAMFDPDPPPPPGAACRDPKKCKDGDPVDLGTGLFVLERTDIFLPDIIPIALTRTYRQGDTNSRRFGIGTTHPYQIRLWNPGGYLETNLILPDGGRIHYVRISPGTGFADAVFEHTATQTEYYKSKITWNGNGWDLKLKNGMVYVFGDNAPLQSIRDRYGNQLTITRPTGPTGNISRITSPNGRWVEFTYDASNRITEVEDNIGRVVTYTYDASGRLWKVTDPNNGVTEHTYDDTVPSDANRKTRMLTLKDARSIVFLTNEYDANGRVFKQTQADTTTYQFTYTVDGSGKVTQTDVTDPRANIRRVTFNADGQMTSDRRALGKPEEQLTTYELQTGTNLLLSMTDALNRKTSYTYDSVGNVTSVTRLADTPNAVTTTFTYEPTFNQVTSITDPLNHTTTFGYDAQGNLTSVTNALNQTTTLTYNAAGQPTSIKDPLDNTTQFTYDFGDLRTVADPLGNSTNRFIDAAGRLAIVTDPLENLTRYGYDSLNRFTTVTDPLHGLTQFGYDPNGNLTGVTDAKNQPTIYTYNNMDRLETRKDPLLSIESYQYDGNGNLSQFTDRKSQVSTYTYDALNRRTGVTYADTSTTTYTYDAGNRLTQMVDSISGTITRTYDGLNRLTSETTPQGSVSYTYDTASRRTSMTVFGQPTINYAYDNANRLTQITQGSSIVGFGYDAAGRRTSLTLANGILVEYAHDAASRVTGITYKQGQTVLGNLTYEYDKAGNRTKIGGSFARTGIPDSITSASYNAANQQTALGNKSMSFDNNGNLTSIIEAAGTTNYTWNARNQLTAISGPSVNASFVYDGLGRREKKTINSSLTEFLYDGVNPVQETSGVTVLANILAGLGIDEYFSRADVPAGVTSTFLADAVGSPLALADSAGTVQTEYTYEPFGRTTVTGASNTNTLQYTGRENDGTGLYHYRARYYHPHLQRFVSEDPIEFAGGDVNLYAYVGNDPGNFIDPFGLRWWWPRIPPPPAGQPLPPGWSSAWRWEYGPRNSPRWWDPKGGEWRWSPPGESAKWHPEFPKGHWDHNPWDQWNSRWRNVPPGVVPPMPSDPPPDCGRKCPEPPPPPPFPCNVAPELFPACNGGST
jgi:RHS repeat-associated protein